jgi:SAM-dependent methyltransferase
MPVEPWSYDLLAEFYDEDMGRNQRFDDLAGYRQLLPPAPASILEYGCGTGRLTLPLWQAGYQLCAVDRSWQMLKALRNKLASSVTFAAGSTPPLPLDLCAADAAQPPLRGRFSAVLFAYCGFQYLLDTTELDAFFTAVRRLLAPDGVLILDTFIPRPQLVSEHFKRDYRRRMANGHSLERWKRIRPAAKRINCVERRYVVAGRAEQAITTVSRQRTYTPEQLDATLADHGFTVRHRLYDYASKGVDRQRAQFYTVAARAA